MIKEPEINEITEKFYSDLDDLLINSFYAPYAFLAILYRFEHHVLLSE